MQNDTEGHWSDCSVHNEPAYPGGPCDCIPSEDNKDPGAHYRHNLRIKVTQEDLERGHIDVQLDPAKIDRVYNLNGMGFTMLKKVLRMGRGNKTKRQDLIDIGDAARRELELMNEDADEVRT